jgi:hypothetical protein
MAMLNNQMVFVGIRTYTADFVQYLEVPLVSYPFLDAIWCPRKIVAAHGNMDEAHVVGTQRFVEVDELRPVGDRDTCGIPSIEHQGLGEPEQGTWMGLEVPGLLICFRRCFWRTEDWQRESHSHRSSGSTRWKSPEDSRGQATGQVILKSTRFLGLKPIQRPDTLVHPVDIIILECILIPIGSNRKQRKKATACGYWMLLAFDNSAKVEQ